MSAYDPMLSGTALIERRLLLSIVDVARAVFGAAASSIFLVEETTGDLVFEAVAGEGEEHLIGMRFPQGTGIAGWVAASGQPMIADDLLDAPFARDAAESTGYVPSSIMAAPLFRGEEVIGVLEVLDRSTSYRGELADVDLLSLIAAQAACGLELLLRLRHTDTALSGADDVHILLQRIATRVPRGAPHPTALKLLAAADELLA